MKIKLFLFFLFISTLTVLGQQKKPRIAVYMTGDDPINEIVCNRLNKSLLVSGRYQPVERSDAFLAALSKEHQFERNGTVDDDEIARLGKQFGIQYVCVASILDVWDNEKYISAHLVDVNSAEVVGSFSSNGTIDSPSSLMNYMEDLSDKLGDIIYNTKKNNTSKVAVYVVRTGNKDVDIILGDQLVSGFANSGEYLAVERTNAFLKQINKETQYQQSGAVDDNTRLAELGKRFGVQYVCVAKTSSWEGAYFISARLINVETAAVENVYNAENVLMNNSNDVVKVSQEIAENLSDGPIYDIVEEGAEFPGGMTACYEFLSKNIKYPPVAQEQGIQGDVVVQFVVGKDGSITDVKVVKENCYINKDNKGVSKKVKEVIDAPCLRKEAVRVVELMPKWKPARQGLKRVRSLFTLPINFRLS